MRGLTIALAIGLAVALAAIGALVALYLGGEEASTVSTTTVTRTVAAEPPSGPPPGLARYGRLLWNFEALLRDTFGVSTFYSNPGESEGDPLNFDTEFRGNCCSGSWEFTFADARDSDFRLLQPQYPPDAVIGVSGGSVPLTVDGRRPRTSTPIRPPISPGRNVSRELC